MTATETKEKRLRRAADRQGLTLRKSRTRDQRALDYGKYWLESEDATVALGGGRREGATLDEVERYLNGEEK